MRTSMKWMLPVTAFAVLLAIGISARGEEAKAEGKATINGTVTGEDGTPAANVEVRVMPPRPPRGERPVRAPQEQAEDGDKPGDAGKPPRPEPIAKTTTDADGKYSLEVPAGKFMIIAGKRNMGMGREEVTVADGETKTVDLKLKKMKPGEGRPGGPKPGKDAPAPE